MFKVKNLLAVMLLVATQMAAVPAFAQDEDEDAEEPEMTQDEGGDQDKAEAKPDKDAPKKNPDVEKYEKAIKDATKYEGAFTLYTRKSDVLLELSEDMVGKTFMAQASLNRGFAAYMGQAGEPVGDGPVSIFRWERSDDKIVLMRPHTRFRWSESDPLATASQRTFPEAIVGTFRIENKHPEKKLLLVNVTPFFHGAPFDLAKFISEAVGGQAGPDREFTKVETIRNVGDATVVKVDTHFKSQGGGELNSLLAMFGLLSPTHLEESGSVPFKVTYTLWYRKDTGYLPRIADPRIGYFTQDFFSVDRFSEIDRTERYIARFNLKKKDPAAMLSEPEKPIVWTVDSSVPERYRQGVKNGILAWNKAFEKVGYKDAIRVEDAPAEGADYDHADGIRNVVRWNMSEDMAYAVAHMRIDPLTGEVHNASVSIDANFAAYTLNDYDLSIRQAKPSRQLAEQALLRTAPGLQDPVAALTAPLAYGEEVPLGDWTRARCSYGSRLAQDAAFSWAALKSAGAKIEEEDFMNQFLTDLVMHEVGHCLGLRHNFAGSTQLNIADMLNDAKVSTVGLSASVMDYTPVNTPAILRGNGVFFNTTIGPYDEWAIAYGYTPITAFDPDDEKPLLNLIARRSGEPGLMFMTDEDADGVNPLAVRFDLGADTVDWLKTQLQSNADVRSYALNGYIKNGEGYGPRTDLVLSSFLRDFSSSLMASRFVGGVEVRRNHKGDVGEKPTLTPVSAAMQRKAIRMVIDKSINVTDTGLPSNVMFGLSTDPNYGMGGQWNAPLRDFFGRYQSLILAVLMSARKVDDIAENEFKMPKGSDRYTVAEHYNVLFSAVFSEIGGGKSVAPLRRDLQNFMIDGLIKQASAPTGAINDDARVAASQGLVRLKKRFDDQVAIPSGLDAATLLHCKEISDRLQRYQERQVTGGR